MFIPPYLYDIGLWCVCTRVTLLSLLQLSPHMKKHRICLCYSIGNHWYVWIKSKPVGKKTEFCYATKLVRAIDTQKPASTTLLNDRRINFSCGLWLRCHPSYCVKSNQTLAQAGSWCELATGDKESSSLVRNKECYVLLCQLMKLRADTYLQRQAQTWALWGLMQN